MILAAPAVPCEPCGMQFFECEAVRNIQKPPFSQQLLQSHYKRQNASRYTIFRRGFLSFDGLSGEVKHVVHLIRWTLKAVICQLGQDLTTVPVQGIVARLLGN